jgi:hypothetical protein
MEYDRLKSLRSGAQLQLREEDLLISHLICPSPAVHQVRTIIRADGHLEYGEYLADTSIVGRFRHYHGEVPQEILSSLRVALPSLAQAHGRMDLGIREFDPFEHEPQERCHVRYWSDGSECGSSRWRTTLYAEIGTPGDLWKAYLVAFDAVWRLIDEAVCAVSKSFPSSGAAVRQQWDEA